MTRLHRLNFRNLPGVILTGVTLPSITLGCATLACFILLHSEIALAQTAISTPNQGQVSPATNIPHQPVAEATVVQTRNHINGVYTKMERLSQGGQIQEAWDGAATHSAIFTYKACATCSYKMLLREFMTSVIKLPEGEKITDFEVGDPSFNPIQVDHRTISILPNGYGMDTSLLIYGEDGRLYPFYLRAEGVNSQNIPDLVVRITGHIAHERPSTRSGGNFATSNYEEEDKIASSSSMDSMKDMIGSTEEKSETVSQDFVEDIPFDADKLHGFNSYELWGEGWADNQKPVSVFRDDRFTYIQFGKNWKNLELPTAYVVVDDIDELVNSRVSGSTYIIESINPLISLKSGESFLCLLYQEEASHVK